MFGKDKDHYPLFYRLIPITEQIVIAHLALVRKLNWKRILIISFDSEFYLDVSTRIAGCQHTFGDKYVGCIVHCPTVE